VIDKEILLVSLFGKKTLAIWGTGNTAKKFTTKNQWLLRTNIFYIDNNCEKGQDSFRGKKVKNPKEIEDWSELFVVITSIYYSEIKQQIESYGLKEDVDFIAYDKFASFLLGKIESCSDKVKVKKLLHDGRWEHNLKDFYAQIASEKITSVCFQMENVLLLGGRRDNIYKILGRKARINGFSMIRKLSQYIAEQNHGGAVGIDQIYDTISEFFSIPINTANQLKQEEIAITKKVLWPRRCMKEVYDYALRQGKKILIASRYLYDKKCIEEILQSNGYGEYSALYLREEFQDMETLIDILSEESPQGFLYISSDYMPDIEKKPDSKYEIFYMPNPGDAMSSVTKLSSYFNYSKEYVDNSLIYDLVINIIFDDPFVEYDIESLFNGQLRNMSLILFAPIILEYVIWMFQQVVKEGVEQIVWVYRDGYLPERIFEIIRKKCDCDFTMSQLFLSRAIRYFAENSLMEAIEQLPVNRMMTVEKFVSRRLLVHEEEKKKEILDYIYRKVEKDASDVVLNMMQIMCLYPCLNKCYLDNTQEKSKIITEYCKSVLGDNKKNAVFDIGYRGRVIDFIYKKTGIKTLGFHLFKKTNVDRRSFGYENTKGFVEYGGNTLEELMILNALFEDIISVQEGTAIDIKKINGEYEIIKEPQKKNNDFITEIQKIILDFSDQFICKYADYLLVMDFDQYNDFNLISEFLKNPYIDDAKLLKNMRFVESDFLVGNSSNNFYDNWFEKRVGNIMRNKE